MKKSILTAAVLTAVLPAFVFAGNLNFLKGISIKDSGMAGASAPFAAESASAMINPAGLGLVPMQELSLVYYNLFEGSLFSSASYALPLLEKGTFAATVLMMNTESIDERDQDNQLIGTFSDSVSGFNLAYGVSLFPFLSVGVSAGYTYHNFYTERAGAFDAGLGVLLSLPYNISASLEAGNIIRTEFKYTSGESDIIPLNASADAGITFSFVKEIKDLLKISAGAGMEEFSKDISWRAGAEYSLYEIFSLRGGICRDGFAAGAGVKYNNIELNYALTGKPLGLIHRFSVAYSFGDNIRLIESQFKSKEAKAKYELVEKIKRETVAKFEQEITDSIKSGDYDGAKIAVDKALIWAPDDPWFMDKSHEITNFINTGRVKNALAEADLFMKQDAYIDAMVSLKTALDIDPENTQAKDKFKRAQEMIMTLGEKNLSVQEGNKTAIKLHFEAGLNNYAAGNYEKSIEEWNQVIKASPLQRMVYSYIQSAQAKVKKKEQAVNQEKFDRDKKLQDLYNSAVVQYSKGEFEKSIGLWREYLKADPENKEAKDYLEKITKEYMELQKQKLEW